MVRKTDNKKVIKAISIGLSVYMALSPVVVSADEMPEAGAKVEVRHEATESPEQTAENTEVSESQDSNENTEVTEPQDSNENTEVSESQVTSESTEVSESQVTSESTEVTEPQAIFENKVAEIGIDVINTEIMTDDTSSLAETEINRIENDAIKEAADAITAVDMTNVDDALNKVSSIVDDVITDEVVATELETAADTLIAIYDSQAEIALDALTVISEKTDAVTVKEDGSVSIDWNAATEDVTKLYNEYQDALKAKGDAQTAKEQIEANKNTVSGKVDEFEKANIDKNIDTISASKESKNTCINDTIARVAEEVKNNNKSMTKGLTIDGTVNDSSDMYRFFVNVVEKGTAYGCLTYYDAESKTILRKNFKISSDGIIDFDYIPKSEWVKGDANCKSELFGNGGNYIAAYVGDNTSNFITLNKDKKVLEFSGKEVSTLMRNNVQLNDDISARNEALAELKNINTTLGEAENALKEASEGVDDALRKYQEAVAMYKNAASLNEEIKKDVLEKAKLEYVKAEVNAFRKQQELNQIKETINNSDTTEKEKIDNPDASEKEKIDNPDTSEKEKIDNPDTSEKEKTDSSDVSKTEEKDNSGMPKKEKVDNSGTSKTEEIDNSTDTMNIETVINNVATNLGVAPESIENLVVQTIIDTEESYASKTNETNHDEEIAVLGERRSEVEVEEVNESEAIYEEIVTNEEEVVEITDIPNEAQNIVTIEENMVPLSSGVVDASNTRNWRSSLILALTSMAGIILAIVKKKDKDEEEEEKTTKY